MDKQTYMGVLVLCLLLGISSALRFYLSTFSKVIKPKSSHSLFWDPQIHSLAEMDTSWDVCTNRLARALSAGHVHHR